jgi:polyketide cyclase/dehydrase/lipid transport protein
MLQGTGTTHTQATPGAALAYLADPRHAAEWFANVAVEGLAAGRPRAGQTWRFVERGGRDTSRPMRLALYDPGARFIWETQLGPAHTNITWEVEATAAPEGGATLRLTTRWRPGPLGWPATLAATLLARGAAARRTQRTIERARDAMEAQASPAPRGPQRTPPPSAKRRVRR